MKPNSKFRAIVPAAVVGLLALALLAPQASAAQNVPTLASTPQYKAFSAYVDKLRDLRGEPHTAGQKATYERQLTAKHTAVVNRAKALFQRGKAAAKAETQAGFKSASKKIRKAEAAELAALRAEYVDRMDRAADAFRDDVDAVEAKFDRRYASIQRQIRTLRMRKAKAKGLARKDQIQSQINVLVEQVSDSRRQEREAIDRLKDRYSKQKRAIRAAKTADTAEITEARQEAVDSLRARWNRAYSAKIADLQERRSNQLANLERKLSAGRAAIASMPVAG
jgi:hypothetical protein